MFMKKNLRIMQDVTKVLQSVDINIINSCIFLEYTIGIRTGMKLE